MLCLSAGSEGFRAGASFGQELPWCGRDIVPVMDGRTFLTDCMGRILTSNLFCFPITLEKASLGFRPESCINYQLNGLIPVLRR